MGARINFLGFSADAIAQFLGPLRPLLAVTDGDDRFRQLSANWEEALGRSLDKLKSTSFIEFIHPEDRSRTFREMIKMESRDQDLRHFVNRYRHQDGHYLHLMWFARKTTDGRVYAAAIDVSGLWNESVGKDPLKKLKEGLTNRELCIFESFQSSPDGTITKADLQAIVYGGHKVSEMTLNVHVSNLRKKLCGTQYTVCSKGPGLWCLEDHGHQSSCDEQGPSLPRDFIDKVKKLSED